MKPSKWPAIKPFPFASLLLVVFYLSEAYSKYSFLFLDGKSSIQRMLKLGVLIFLTIAIFKKSFKPFLWFALLSLGFLLGQLFLTNGFQLAILVNFGKYLFPILLFLYFALYPSALPSKKLFFKTFEVVILLNSVLVLCGFLFDLSLFSTYQGSRFGYNGLFLASATGSYVYLIAIYYFLITLQEQFLKSWKTLFLLPVAFLLGTKVVFAGILAAVLLWIWFYAGFSKTRKWLLLAGFSVLILAGAYFFFFEYGIFNEIRENRGLVDAVFSFRNDLWTGQTLPFIKNNWNFGNLLFGGITDLTTQSQMDIIDIFYFWGLLGGMGYLFLYGKYFLVFPIKKSTICCLLVIFGLSLFAGHFFVNASLAIYLLVLRERLLDDTDMKIPYKNE